MKIEKMSKVAQVVARHLSPPMLFLVVMSIISLIGTLCYSKYIDNQYHIAAAFWLWFISMLVIMGFGVYVLVLDARIQLRENTSHRNAG